jgi:maltoporin
LLARKDAWRSAEMLAVAVLFREKVGYHGKMRQGWGREWGWKGKATTSSGWKLPAISR